MHTRLNDADWLLSWLRVLPLKRVAAMNCNTPSDASEIQLPVEMYLQLPVWMRETLVAREERGESRLQSSTTATAPANLNLHLESRQLPSSSPEQPQLVSISSPVALLHDWCSRISNNKSNKPAMEDDFSRDNPLELIVALAAYFSVCGEAGEVNELNGELKKEIGKGLIRFAEEFGDVVLRWNNKAGGLETSCSTLEAETTGDEAKEMQNEDFLVTDLKDDLADTTLVLDDVLESNPSDADEAASGLEAFDEIEQLLAELTSELVELKEHGKRTVEHTKEAEGEIERLKGQIEVEKRDKERALLLEASNREPLTSPEFTNSTRTDPAALILDDFLEQALRRIADAQKIAGDVELSLREIEREVRRETGFHIEEQVLVGGGLHGIARHDEFGKGENMFGKVGNGRSDEAGERAVAIGRAG